MKYYLLNIIEEKNKVKINTVDKWMKEKVAPIFYDDNTTVAGILKEKKPRDAYTFCKSSVEKDWLSSRVVAIGNEKIYFFNPASEAMDYHNKYKNIHNNVKGCSINIIRTEDIKDVPLILSTLKSNSYLRYGAFREISKNTGSYLGNKHAIDYYFGSYYTEIMNYEDYLYCLSSLEFETLIAKLLEEKGFFIPSYKGGFLKDLDLIARNYANKDLVFEGLVVKPNESISFQIKLHMKILNNNVDYNISMNSLGQNKHLSTDWIINQLKNSPITKRWLDNSLRWVRYKP